MGMIPPARTPLIWMPPTNQDASNQDTSNQDPSNQDASDQDASNQDASLGRLSSQDTFSGQFQFTVIIVSAF
jgi:hypothetical protein